MTLRNKVEDIKVVPIWIQTDKMLADLGTKALEPKPFVSLRDRICGKTPRCVFRSKIGSNFDRLTKDKPVRVTKTKTVP